MCMFVRVCVYACLCEDMFMRVCELGLLVDGTMERHSFFFLSNKYSNVKQFAIISFCSCPWNYYTMWNTQSDNKTGYLWG